MIHMLKSKLNKKPELKSFLRRPFGTIVNWFYAAYLTLRYVDKYQHFPAFKFNGFVKVRISKDKGGRLVIHERLILERWLNGDGCTSISIGKDAICVIEREFALGNGIRISIAKDGKLILRGRERESASGITANSVVMVNKYVEIGKDCLIAWDNYITDCDWHHVEGKESTMPTIIGDHVWLGVGVKVLKGAMINKDTIVTSMSVVLKGNYPENSLLGGSPATLIKSNAPKWHREMKDKK